MKQAFFLAFMGCVIALPLSGHSSEPIEEPLSLSTALEFAHQTHPLSRAFELDSELAEQMHRQLKSGNRLEVNLLATPQRVDRAAQGTSNSLDDSSTSIQLNYPLYDFGRRDAAVNQAAVSLELAQGAFDHNLQQRRIDIMRRFFNVLISDLDYGVKNEKMTLAFLRFNRYSEELEMFEAHAEVDVLELEVVYRDTFHTRQQAGIEQMGSRRLLGLAMGLPEYVPRDLQLPDLSEYVEREVPEFEVLLEQVLGSSHAMKAAQLDVQWAQWALTASEKRYMPSVNARLEAIDWKQNTGSRNSAAIGLQIRVPLVSDARKAIDRETARIGVERAEARVAQVNHELQTRVFELWKALRLHHVNLTAARVRLDYRDQYMDRARSRYELEEVADIGNAQAEQLNAYLELKRVEFDLTLAWAEMDVLRGMTVFPN